MLLLESHGMNVYSTIIGILCNRYGLCHLDERVRREAVISIARVLDNSKPSVMGFLYVYGVKTIFYTFSDSP